MNRKDLSPGDDFVLPCTFQKGQKGKYKLVFLKDDERAIKELQAFIKSKVGLFGVLKIKVGFERKLLNKNK